jgi:hypothetical protein
LLFCTKHLCLQKSGSPTTIFKEASLLNVGWLFFFSHVNIGTFDPITPKLPLSLYYERRSKATYL